MRKSEMRGQVVVFLVRRLQGMLAPALGLSLCVGSCSTSENSATDGLNLPDANLAIEDRDTDALEDDTDRRISVDTGFAPGDRGDATKADLRTATVTCIGFWTINATSDRTGTGTCTVTVMDSDGGQP